jgi:hypothetical protein
LGTGRRWVHLDARAGREIIVGLALLFCYGFFRQVPAWNEYSRYDLVRALVEDGTTRIDRLEQNTGDKAFYDGHYYSDKTPGTAFLGVPVYRLLTLTSTTSGGGTPDPLTAVQALAFVESGIPTVLVVLLLLRLLRPAAADQSWVWTRLDRVSFRHDVLQSRFVGIPLVRGVLSLMEVAGGSRRMAARACRFPYRMGSHG